jgi:uncharacterized membrane protein
MQYGFTKFGEESGYIVSLMGAVEAVTLVSSAVIAFQVCFLAQWITQLDSTPPDTFWYAFIPAYFIIRIAGQVLVNKALLMLHDGRKISWDEILGFDFGYHIPLIMRMMAATIAYWMWAMLLTLILIIPGLFATSTLRFFKFTIVDHDTDAVEGLRESYELAGENKGELVSLNVLTSGMRLIGMLCLGVGFVPASAICGLAEAYAYKRLAQAYEYQQQHLGTQQL